MARGGHALLVPLLRPQPFLGGVLDKVPPGVRRVRVVRVARVTCQPRPSQQERTHACPAPKSPYSLVQPSRNPSVPQGVISQQQSQWHGSGRLVFSAKTTAYSPANARTNTTMLVTAAEPQHQQGKEAGVVTQML